VSIVFDVNHRMRAAIIVTEETNQIILRPPDAGRALYIKVYVSAIRATGSRTLVFEHRAAKIEGPSPVQIEYDVCTVDVVPDASDLVPVEFDH